MRDRLRLPICGAGGDTDEEDDNNDDDADDDVGMVCLLPRLSSLVLWDLRGHQSDWFTVVLPLPWGRGASLGPSSSSSSCCCS